MGLCVITGMCCQIVLSLYNADPCNVCVCVCVCVCFRTHVSSPLSCQDRLPCWLCAKRCWFSFKCQQMNTDSDSDSVSCVFFNIQTQEDDDFFFFKRYVIR